MWKDPIVAEVHKIREQLSSRFDFDVDAIFDDIRSREAAMGPRLVAPRQRAEPAEAVELIPRSTSLASPGTEPTVPAN